MNLTVPSAVLAVAVSLARDQMKHIVDVNFFVTFFLSKASVMVLLQFGIATTPSDVRRFFTCK